MAVSGVVTVDCQYEHPQHAAAYLLAEPDAAAFVDNNTAHAVPLLMQALADAGLAPEQVCYIVITHLHFDHAGGTSALLKQCPKAQVLCHPLAVRHLIDPSRLVASASRVYGEAAFRALYGVIEPIDSDRVRGMDDGETVKVGRRTLTFWHTPGHAKHHVAIHDTWSNGVFTGDIFGIMHASPARTPDPCLLFSSAPTDYNADQARSSIQSICDSGADRVYLTHFGEYRDLDRGRAQLFESIDGLEEVRSEASASRLEGDALQQLCERGVRRVLARQFERWAVPMTPADWDWLEADIRINAMGLALCVTA
jgi:glyoxylase-like metal-dependent hydrolase (beta-lactamase superfamily II)